MNRRTASILVNSNHSWDRRNELLGDMFTNFFSNFLQNTIFCLADFSFSSLEQGRGKPDSFCSGFNKWLNLTTNLVMSQASPMLGTANRRLETYSTNELDREPIMQIFD